MSLQEFEVFLSKIKVGRTIMTIQQHHTYSPDYALFNGKNHFALQMGMKNYHVNNNGWADIGQHLTIFPDGVILTGRSMEQTPACIFGQNAQAICIENLGNFDRGKDKMTAVQREAIVRATALLCTKFSIPVDSGRIVYHHWFRLDNGARNNGGGNNKSCPGTDFFGGNKVEDAERYFLPLVRKWAVSARTAEPVIRFVAVTATSLNVRSRPSGRAARAIGRVPISFGSVLRVYGEKNGWYKISSSASHWVYGVYTLEVKQAVVTCDVLNVRNAADAKALKVGSLTRGTELFVYELKDGWARIGMTDRWVSAGYLKIEN